MGAGLSGRRVYIAALALGSLLLGAGDAFALEAFEGRLQAHGFFETRFAFVNDDLSDDFDVANMIGVASLELELDIAPEGWGPFALLQAFARVSTQYDCVYTRGCGLFRSMDMVGDRAKVQPGRLSGAREHRFSLTLPYVFGDVDGDGIADPPDNLPPDSVLASSNELTGERTSSNRAGTIFNVFPFRDLFDNALAPFGVNDDPTLQPCQKTLRQDAAGASFSVFADPASYVNERYCDYRFAAPEFLVGPSNFTGPYRPQDAVHAIAALRDRANPFNHVDTFQLFDSRTGFVETFRGLADELPFRPAPRLSIFDAPGEKTEAQGLYIPSVGLRRIVDDIERDNQQNFRQAELTWNRGQSQQDEKELKEIYLDLELFDGSLWARLGKQTVVWGKTELFRNQDRWNPTDIGLGPLASLEEGRIALWMGRFVWLIYDLGPLHDFRIETAFVYDQFEPFDTGQCGEPLLPRAICGIRLGLFSHGFSGLGLAGEIRPPDPWDSAKGIEVGMRVEFRWRRFSFAVTDYYGYQDIPNPDIFFTFERNVDPRTGRPRRAESRAGCDPAGLFDGDVSGCLGVFSATGPPGTIDPVATRAAASSTDPSVQAQSPLLYHSANQQLLAQICAGTVGTIPDVIDPTRSTCAQTIFNSQTPFGGAPIASLFANILVGNETAVMLAELTFVVFQGMFVDLPEVPLNVDPCDGFLSDCVTVGNPPRLASPGPTLNQVLTTEQQALLGCGHFFGTDCELAGVDLLNMEASAIFQSWFGFEGTEVATTLAGPQPGTVGFLGGPVCTRFEGGVQTVIAGCRAQFRPDGSLNPGWNVNVDGNATGLVHPYTGAQFASEMAALSWNFQLVILVLGALAADDPMNPGTADFDASAPFRRGACSLAEPHLCDAVRGFSRFSGNQHPRTVAGGNGRFGRRDFLWHGGSPVVLRYPKNNVLGFAVDFAEDFTATSWGVEFSWANDVPVQDNGSLEGLTEVDQYNLTISVDRPTFITFMNGNRSFIFNAQLFVGYEKGYRHTFPGNGPWSSFGTLTVLTGYLQDRLNPSLTFVYDAGSNSGGFLPSVQYRYSESFSVTFGGIFLFGRRQTKELPLRPGAVVNQVDAGPFKAYKQVQENFISAARDLDQLTLRIRYTF